jgi:hypothetical protein
MRQRCGVVLVAAVAACAGLVPAAGAASTSPLSASGAVAAARIRWGKAGPVPGVAELNSGYNASVSYITQQPYGGSNWSPGAISCWGAGGCVAGGFYTDKHGHAQAYVARERKGRWGRAQQVPGTAALNKGGNAGVGFVSCARTTVCVAAGTYTNAGNGGEWFTSTERDGRWTTAAEVPVPTLDGAGVNAVWCAPGGLCIAGGGFKDSSGAIQAWVQTQAHGRWQPAVEVPGLAALNVGGDASLDAVTCASAGNCVAGGQYATTAPPFPFLEPFLVSETDGHWGAAQEVPGIGPVNTPDIANGNTSSIVCPSAGSCTAAGYYQDGDDPYCVDSPESPADGCSGLWLDDERHGRWGQVTATGASSYVLWLTCPAAGDCVVAGEFENGRDVSTGTLVGETNDRWGPVLTLPSTQEVNSVSCASAGYCSAGGQNNSGTSFVISEWHGTWGKVITPAGLFRGGSGGVSAVACPPRITLCVAGGDETPRNGVRAQAFVVSQVR